MLSVYRTLSLRYLARRWVRAILIVASIALGVATLVATRALNQTMSTAGLATINPMPGVVDLLISNGEGTISADLAKTLARIPGVQEASPRIFDKIKLPNLDNKSVLVMGIGKDESQKNQSVDVTFTLDEDVKKVLEETKSFLDKNKKLILTPAMKQFITGNKDLDEDLKKTLLMYLDKLADSPNSEELVVGLVSKLLTPVMVGEELNNELLHAPRAKPGGLADLLSLIPGTDKYFAHLVSVQKSQEKPKILLRVGTVKAKGVAAFLGGYTLTMELADAAWVLGMEKGQVNRIDITLKKEANKAKVRAEVEKLAKGHGVVRTPQEQNEALGSVMAGMQTGFALCGLAALVVGLFLVYNALAVCVAERRHEIGILLSLGASRLQVCLLFAGEAAALGLAGSLIGIPLGIGLAYLGLQPMQDVLRDIFMDIDANQVEVGFGLMALALAAGMVTAVAAALVPAVSAAKENPAEAVRQVAKAPTWHYVIWQAVCTFTLVGLGFGFIILRNQLGFRQGAYGGMVLVLLGALVAAPLVTAGLARLMQPFARRFFPITWRLAADNLVRAPGRTGLVIAALAAGVALVTQTYGTIVSNRTALRDWVQEYIAADLLVSAGSPVGAGSAQSQTMKEEVARQILDANRDPRLKGVAKIKAALPSRELLLDYGDTQVKLFAFDASSTYRMEREKQSTAPFVELYKILGETPRAAIISENFAALHNVRKGDTIVLPVKGQEVRLLVIGLIMDYSWNKGTIFIDREEYKKYWDSKVKYFDVFLQGPLDEEKVKQVQETLRTKLGLFVTTRKELQTMIDDMIERLYGIALSLQFVVMVVAALGVVTALLISVLQRKREMGLLRAIGASRSQVVRSFQAEAFLMGVIGTLIGFLVGIPMEWYVLKVLILQESGFLFAVHIPWAESLIIVAAGLLIPLIAGQGPAMHSVRQRIPEAIAYE
ncbi:MAG TPA: FtsX-like permease family protein [Gemmataceae bacterium]|nr:FtsX-like permease family protein [Gemmataceae bacterium]